jgi:hypothetical protein
MEIPVFASDLIKMLDETIPKGNLTPTDFTKSERELWFRAGKRCLVDDLKHTLEDQEKKGQNLLRSDAN